MGFFDSLRRTLGVAPTEGIGPINPRLAGAANVPDEGDPRDAAEPESFRGIEYDRKNWLNKFKALLDGLPGSIDLWREHMADALSLGIEPATVRAWGLTEFTLLVRRAVADRVVTESEHRKLDLARDLLEIPDADAEAILQSVVAEAEGFFGKSVQGA